MAMLIDLKTPGLRIYSNPECTIIAGRLPGVKNVTVHHSGKQVHVKAIHPQHELEEAIPLPHTYNPEHTITVFHNEVLKIIIPKSNDERKETGTTN